MRNRLIAFYGGTDLSQEVAAFVGVLAREVLQQTDISLVTGGFSHRAARPQDRSVDRATLEGAKAFAQARGIPLNERLQTWLPEPTKDRREEGVVRFEEGLLRRLKGKSAQARRFALVSEVDALVTFHGEVRTAMVLDLALAINKPALPLPFTGGDSERYWPEQRDQIQDWFHLSDMLRHRMEETYLKTLPEEECWTLAREIKQALLRGVRRTCLVLMEFSEAPTLFYDEVVEPAIREEGFEPIRIDRKVYTGAILETFLARLDDSDCIIADVTAKNPNVMYELGHAHARRPLAPPFLFTRETLGEDYAQKLPFYLLPHMVEACDASSAPSRAAFAARLRAYLLAGRKSAGKVAPA